MRERLGGLLVGLVLLPCCSLFVSTSDFSGADELAPDGAPPGAATDSGGSSSEGSSSGALPDDAAGPHDAGAEAGDAFCDASAVFCTDFEDGAGIAAFSSTLVAPGTTLAVEAGESRSPTRALHVTTSRTSAQQVTSAYKFLPNVYEDVRLRFAMRMDAPVILAGDRGTHVFEFNVRVASTNVIATLEVMPDRSVIAYVSVAAPADAFRTLTKPITYGTWHAFDVEVRLTSNRFRISMDGTEVLDRQDLVFPPPSTPSSVSYGLGASSQNVPHPGVSIRFDDVRADER